MRYWLLLTFRSKDSRKVRGGEYYTFLGWQTYCLQENSNDSHWPSRPKISLFSGLTRNDDAFQNHTQHVFSEVLHLYNQWPQDVLHIAATLRLLTLEQVLFMEASLLGWDPKCSGFNWNKLISLNSLVGSKRLNTISGHCWPLAFLWGFFFPWQHLEIFFAFGPPKSKEFLVGSSRITGKGNITVMC